MVVAALPLALFFYLVFAPPEGLGEMQLGAYLACFAVLTRGAMTLYHVPHLSLGAELSTDCFERTQIVKLRSIFQQVGAYTGAGAMLLYFMRATPQFEDGRFNQAAYSNFAGCFAVVMLVTIWLSAWKTRDRIPHLYRPEAASEHRPIVSGMIADIREALTIPSFRALFLGTTLLFIAVGVATNISMHINTFFWKISTAQIALIGVGGGVGIFSGLLFWPLVAEKIDKKPTFLLGLVVFTVFASVPLFLGAYRCFPAHDSWLFMPLLALMLFTYSFGIAATMVTGGSMMADITDEDALIHGRRREGVFFGASAFAAKASVGIGALLAGPIVDFAGFEKGMPIETVPAEAAARLAVADGLAIAILIGLATFAFAQYDLSRERHAQIRASLDARASSASG